MKKGDVSFQVVTLVLIIASLVTLLFFGKAISDIGIDLTGKERCRESFIIKDSVKAGGVVTPFSDIKNNCKTELSVVEDDEKKKVMRKIADQIYWCAWQTGGRDVVSDWSSSPLLTERNYCFPCSVIVFDDNVKNTVKSIDVKKEFIPFLIDENVLGDFNVSYYDYLYDLQYHGRENETEYIKDGELLDLSQPVNVYYAMSKTDYTAADVPFFHNVVLRDMVLGKDRYFYDNGLKLAANSIYVDQSSITNPLNIERDIASSVMVIQNPQGELKFGKLCDVDLTES